MNIILTRKDMENRAKKIQSLGMDLPLVFDGLKRGVSIKQLNFLWQTERSIIKGAINDIELCL